MRVFHKTLFAALITLTLFAPPLLADECTSLLTEAPFVGPNGARLESISTRKMFAALNGKACSPETITAYFETAGWEKRAERVYQPSIVIREELPIDHFMAFCLPRHILLRWIDRCNATASVYSHQGKIAFLNSSLSK